MRALLLLLSFCISYVVQSQVPYEVSGQFLSTTTYNQKVIDVKEVSGGFIMTGVTSNRKLEFDYEVNEYGEFNTGEEVFLLYMDNTFHVQWISYVGGSNNEQPVKVIVTDEGSYTVVGNSTSRDFSKAVYTNVGQGAMNIFFAWFSPSGEHGSTFVYGGGRTDVVHDGVYNDNEIYICGSTDSHELGHIGNNSFHSGFVGRFSSIGELIDLKTYGWDRTNAFYSLDVSSSAIHVTGFTSPIPSVDSIIGQGNTDVVYVETDRTLGLRKYKLFGGSELEMGLRLMYEDGCVYIAGTTFSDRINNFSLRQSDEKAFIMKYNCHTDNIDWVTELDAGNSIGFNHMIYNQGTFYLSGRILKMVKGRICKSDNWVSGYIVTFTDGGEVKQNFTRGGAGKIGQSEILTIIPEQDTDVLNVFGNTNESDFFDDPGKVPDYQDVFMLKLKLGATPRLGERSVVEGCESVTLDAPEGFGYSWNTGADTRSVSVDSSGIYYVNVATIPHCYYPSSPVFVQMSENEIIRTKDTLCLDETIVLMAAKGSDHYWSTGERSNFISVNIPGEYTLESMVQGCMVKTSFYLHKVESVDPLPKENIYCGEDVVIPLEPGITVVKDGTRYSNELPLEQPGVYYFDVYNYGCLVIEDDVTVVQSDPGKSAVIPNLITPNGDGKNDYWVIDQVPLPFSVEVVNRWGQRIFYSTEYVQDFTTMDDGVYFYVIDSDLFCEPVKGVLTSVSNNY